MGQVACCCGRVPAMPSDMDDERSSMYRPPQATVQPIDTNMRLPPGFFRRLDKYIHSNGLRAMDVFSAMDQDHNKVISFDELVDGLHQINFALSPSDEAELLDWITNGSPCNKSIDGVSFKEFTLALKLRAAKTSPPKANRRLSTGAKKLLSKP
ncbi:hypothetical protein ACHHYP_03323 [Achlya hypogyna]|uniref:EF-hand domain-containing protein n=1 Tax=Achlya hypogyna TaxID=1202772 RepID=A0A1V9Z476_ACHHY|nr:hypothetical protein ACHHYP_03323 [Achlya hypogyna]